MYVKSNLFNLFDVVELKSNSFPLTVSCIEKNEFGFYIITCKWCDYINQDIKFTYCNEGELKHFYELEFETPF